MNIEDIFMLFFLYIMPILIILVYCLQEIFYNLSKKCINFEYFSMFLVGLLPGINILVAIVCLCETNKKFKF